MSKAGIYFPPGHTPPDPLAFFDGSLVSSFGINGAVVNGSYGGMAITGGGGGDAAPVVDLTTFSGIRTARARFAPDGGAHYWQEQRFNFGRDLTHVGIKYRMFYPSNYAHGPGASHNDKQLLIWGNDYAQANPLIGFDRYRSGAGPYSTGEVGWTSSATENDFDGAGTRWTSGVMIGLSDLNGWVEFWHEYKLSSNPSTADGIARVWKNGTTIINPLDLRWAHSTPANNILRQGYFWGTDNARFQEETFFWLDLDSIQVFTGNPGWN